MEPVSLAFCSEVCQGYVLKERGVCYSDISSDIYRCFKCIMVDVAKGKLGQEGMRLKVYEVRFLVLFFAGI